ncbi:MAG: D-alanine--D-alanine ligase family protein [Bacteroidota bacterium]
MKKNIAIVTGGNSSEYDISLKSAETVIGNIDRSAYIPFKIVIKENLWLLKRKNKKDIIIDKNNFSCIIDGKKVTFDCVFIAIHGTPGEDGKLQGYFDMLKIPYTTSGVLTSALTFNKNVCKNFLKGYGVLSPISVLLKKGNTPINIPFNKGNSLFPSALLMMTIDGTSCDIKKILSEIQLPCFIKPSNGGSSCGISRVNNEDEMEGAIRKAFEEDDEILVEEFIDGTELTCGVLKHKEELITLPLTEVISKKEFFDYEAKYTPGMAEEITPARVSGKIEKKCKELSAYLFNILNCKGIVRFDYILRNNKLYFLEVNTVPGLTETSFIPQQALAMGINLEKLFGMIIEDALGD